MLLDTFAVGGCVRVHVEGRQVVSWAVRGWRGQKHTRGVYGQEAKKGLVA